METTKQQIESVVRDPKQITGVWQLNYKVTNNNGIAGFGGRLIANYPDPIDQSTRVLKNADGQPLPGYFIEKVQIELFPEKNLSHRNLVDWLIGHPEVGVPNAHANMKEGYWRNKKNNPKITIKNVDHQDLSKLDDEEYIDKLVGRISEEGGKKAIGLERLRFILASLEIMYYDLKYISDPATEKKMLRRKLKGFIRGSMSNAKKAGKIMDDLEKAKYVYEIKELLRFKILEKNNGMFQYQGNPLGISYDSVISYFEEHTEFYNEITGPLYDKIKEMK